MLSGLLAVLAGAWLLAGRPRLRSGQARSGRIEVLADRAAASLLARFGMGASQEDPVALCRALSAELRAGAPPDAALVAVAGGSVLLRRARAAALLGEPVGPALAADAAACRAGEAARSALTGMAACWVAAADTGAGLADGMDRVAALAAAGQRIGADLQAEIAAPRATARILSLLPLLGVALGELLGARPVAWLVGGPIGWLCLLGGGLLLLAGRLWASRIVASALPSPVGRP